MNIAYKLQKLKEKWVESISELTDYEGENFIKAYIIHLIPKLLLIGIATILGVGVFIVLLPVAIVYSILFRIFKIEKSTNVETTIYQHLDNQKNKYKYFRFRNIDNSNNLANKDNTVISYLRLFFFLNSVHDTLRVDDCCYCTNGKRRSLGDIYLITQYYRPDITESQLIKGLIQMCLNRELGGSYCNTINKYVFTQDSLTFNKNSQTEYHPSIQFQDVIKAFK